MSQKATFKIVGDRTIHCNGCESSLQHNLSQLEGVSQVTASRDSQMVEVDYLSDQIDVEKIKAQLDWIGYQAKLV